MKSRRPIDEQSVSTVSAKMSEIDSISKAPTASVARTPDEAREALFTRLAPSLGLRYDMTTPCDQCPFLIESCFTYESLEAHASGSFPCHKQCVENDDGEFVARGPKTQHCAGALIFLEKQERSHQMMRIAERLGHYDRTKLDMDAPVVGCKADADAEGWI
jgi:hypothetical protein